MKRIGKAMKKKIKRSLHEWERQSSMRGKLKQREHISHRRKRS